MLTTKKGLKSQKEREERAKEKLYSLLPDDQKRELVSLFDEFESYGSPEARFAHAMDNVQPLTSMTATKEATGKIIRFRQS